MRINLSSVLVDDQEKALRFYTEILGFVKKTDVPVGAARWLTVVSPDDPDGVELLLEPDGHPAAKPFKQALVDDGIPYTSFAVDDVNAEYDRLRGQGVRFTQQPLAMPSVTLQRILIFIDPAIGESVQRVFDLASLYERVSADAAHKIIASLRGLANSPWFAAGWLVALSSLLLPPHAATVSASTTAISPKANASLLRILLLLLRENDFD